jgi:hypothetical protein
MALLGKGLLAIWNGITDAGEAEFVRWHIREHIPERVGLAGFLRGRRYVALDGHPKYFNFYETETPETLQSPTYQARLNAPTPWTQAVVKEFRDTSRTICEVIASIGNGEGAWIEAIQVGGVEDRSLFSRAVVNDLMKAVAERDGIVAVHFVKAIDGQGASGTAESALRKQPDARCEWLILVEAAEANFLAQLKAGPLSDGHLKKTSPNAKVERGIYRLQYGLTHAELGQPA